MPEAFAQPGFRYDAFISYRHVEPDRGWAKWLHGALETYRVPRALVKKGFPARLTRVFRDEEELPANADLSTQITTALNESQFLIVICSPRAVESRWVNAEVEHFRKLGRHDKILALLIEGSPRESFPRALVEIRRTVVEQSSEGGPITREVIEDVEPLAADVRPERADVRAHTLRGHARLRLIACIIGCRFDDLRQREAERAARRRAVWTGSLAVLSLSLGVLAVLALSQRNEAQYARGLAEQRELESRRSAEAALQQKVAADAARSEADRRRAEAERQAGRANAVVQFVQEMFAAADPAKARGREVTVADALTLAEGRLSAGLLKDQPDTEAAVRLALGRISVALGQFERAEAQLTRAMAMIESLPETSADLKAEATALLGVTKSRLGQLDEGERLLSTVAEQERGSDPSGASAAVTEALRVIALAEAGRTAEARRLLDQVLASVGDGQVLSTTGRLAVRSAQAFVLGAEGRYAESVKVTEALVPELDRLDEEDPVSAVIRSNHGLMLMQAGRADEAETTARQALATAERVLGTDHPIYATVLNTYATIRLDSGGAAELDPLLRRTLAGLRARGASTAIGAMLAGKRGYALLILGRLDEAEAVSREALTEADRAGLKDHISRGQAQLVLGMIGRVRAQYDLAGPAVDEAARIFGVLQPNGGLELAVALTQRALLLSDQGRHEEAASVVRAAIEMMSRVTTPDSYNRVMLSVAAADIFADGGGLQEADRIFSEALATTSVQTQRALRAHGAAVRLANFRRRLGKPAEALELIQSWLDQAENDPSITPRTRVSAETELARVYLALDRGPEAIKAAERSVEGATAFSGKNSDDLIAPLDELGAALVRVGEHARAAETYRRVASLERVHRAGQPGDLALTLRRLGQAELASGQSHEAEASLREALRLRERPDATAPAETALLQIDLGTTLIALGRESEAVPVFERAIPEAEKGERKDLMVLAARNATNSLRRLTRWKDAEAAGQRFLALAEQHEGPASANALIAADWVATSLWRQGRAAEAVPLARRVVESAQGVESFSLMDRMNFTNNLALFLQAAGAREEAAPLFREAMEQARRAAPPASLDTETVTNNLATLLNELGRASERADLLADAANWAGQDEPKSPAATRLRRAAIEGLFRDRRAAQAEPLVRRELELFEPGGAPCDRALALYNMARFHELQGRFAEASDLFTRALPMDEECTGRESADLAMTLVGLGRVRLQLGQAREAVDLFARARRVRVIALPAGAVETIEAAGKELEAIGAASLAGDAAAAQALAAAEALMGHAQPTNRAARRALAQSAQRLARAQPNPEAAAAWTARIEAIDREPR